MSHFLCRSILFAVVFNLVIPMPVKCNTRFLRFSSIGIVLYLMDFYQWMSSVNTISETRMHVFMQAGSTCPGFLEPILPDRLLADRVQASQSPCTSKVYACGFYLSHLLVLLSDGAHRMRLFKTLRNPGVCM